MGRARLNIVFVFFLLFAAAVSLRLAFLQIVKGEFYRALSRGQNNFIQTPITEDRGDIFLKDKNGRLYTLSTNVDQKYAFASPAEIEDSESVANIAGGILGIAREALAVKLADKENLYEPLKMRLAGDEAEALSGAGLRGIYVRSQRSRYFPQEYLGAHIAGFVGADGAGQYGLEAYYDDQLRGKKALASKPSAKIPFLSKNSRIPASNKGSDIVLNIDYNIQFFAENLLRGASKDLGIREGTIIVMDPSTGRILAMANWPGFNPNKYFSQKDWGLFQNPALQKIFEPGSAFKPITMASAIDAGRVTPDTVFEDPGKIQIGGYVIYNYDGRDYGTQTMTGVLEKSVNTGAVFAERQLGHQRFLEYIKKFGFFEPTDIDLAGEIHSENKNLRNGREINFATAAFGHGIEVTPIQMARAFSALVNGGFLVKPFVVDKIIQSDGTETLYEPEIGSQVISKDASNKIVGMLVSVVENGFGKRAGIAGYYIGGKTGTAQVPWTALGIQKAGYSEETIQSFMGFAPAFDPRFLILVKLNNPKTKTAEYSAVPVFRELAKYIIDYWEIPPDYEKLVKNP